ncbi:hypothetical protein L6452_30881 [Arctium lappa]|uniref:Uncharacterized protein n=1 Tax=Arctium lappa TaxID=4217 RepID=A0ACB8ZII1_ARCLA|nr:hypothetical protein L6452_30881 [Arctium lappa]
MRIYVEQRFQEVFSQRKYKVAAQGILHVPDIVANFQNENNDDKVHRNRPCSQEHSREHKEKERMLKMRTTTCEVFTLYKSLLDDLQTEATLFISLHLPKQMSVQHLDHEMIPLLMLFVAAAAYAYACCI